MASNTISIKPLTLIYVLAAIIGVEAVIGWALKWAPLTAYAHLGLIRLIQIGAMLWVISCREDGLAAIGWAPSTWLRGLKIGAVWSICFAAAAGLGMLIVHWTGQNPLKLIHVRLPARTADLVLLFLVGGLIGPLAEELCFRGILYTFFRRWGIPVALIASTAIFVLLHFYRIPVTQVVGGLVFAVAYEVHRNLMVPVVIHVTGNLAIFALSLPVFQTL